MSLYAYTISDWLLAKCGENEKAIQRTHKDCIGLQLKFRKQFNRYKWLYQHVHGACISLSLRALEFSGYAKMLEDANRMVKELEQELDDRKTATDELEEQFEADYNELLEQLEVATAINKALRQTVKALRGETSE